MTAPQRLDRAGFDALVQRAVAALASSVATDPGDPASLADRQASIEEAQLLEAEALSFADAADRADLRNNGDPVPYEDLVVIGGSSGEVVVRLADYDREPIYWQAQAGEVDRLVIGYQLLAVLRR